MSSGHNQNSKMFGMKVLLERRKREWTQEVLAEKADLSRGALGAIERGESSPTLDTIIKLAQAFEIELPRMLDFNF